MINFYESKYTPLVIDLMDYFNQRTNYGSTDYPVDNVGGYNISQIEAAMKNQITLEGWRDNLKVKFDYPSENNLDELFNNYINFR